jgi:hypothetical protein
MTGIHAVAALIALELERTALNAPTHQSQEEVNLRIVRTLMPAR